MGFRFLVSMHNLLPESLIPKPKQYKLPWLQYMHSTRTMAFTIKVYYGNKKDFENKALIKY
jgi:hypothetical protein